jgi:hypothetical protein
VFGRDLVGDLIGRLGGDGDIVVGAVGRADPGEEEPEVIVDLGDSADRGRGFLEVVFCSMEMAGERPSMESTSGLCMTPRNWRA